MVVIPAVRANAATTSGAEGPPSSRPLGLTPPKKGKKLRDPERPLELLGRDATAWVEIAFEGVGWVAFHPTPRETNVPKDQHRPKVIEEDLAQRQAIGDKVDHHVKALRAPLDRRRRIRTSVSLRSFRRLR